MASNPHIRVSFLDAASRAPLEVRHEPLNVNESILLGDPDQRYVIKLEHISTTDDRDIFVDVIVGDASITAIIRKNTTPCIVECLLRRGCGDTLFTLQFSTTELQDRHEEHIEATPAVCMIRIRAYWTRGPANEPPPEPAHSATASMAGNNVHMPYRTKGVKPGITGLSAISHEVFQDDEPLVNVSCLTEPYPFFSAKYKVERRDRFTQQTASSSRHHEMIDLSHDD